MKTAKTKRGQALDDLKALIAAAKEAGEGLVEITPELQSAVNNLDSIPWARPACFSISVCEAWAEEVERTIARAIAMELTR